jgi:hypothetical protein
MVSKHLLLVFSLLFLVSCNEEDAGIEVFNEPFDTIIQIQQNLPSGRYYNIKKLKSGWKGIQPFPFRVDIEKLKETIDKLRKVDIDPNAPGMEFTGIRPAYINIRGKDTRYVFEGYQKGDANLVIIKTYRGNQPASHMAGGMNKEKFQKLFTSLEHTRPYKVILPEEVQEVRYLHTGRPITKDQWKELKDLVSEIEVKNYVFNYRVDKSTMAKHGVGMYRNDNLKAGFEILGSDNRKYYLYFGRPHMHRPVIRVWSSIESAVLEGEFDAWDDLKDLEKNLR